MSKKEALTEDARNAIFDAARAGVLEAYAENAGVRVNYFRAVEMLLYNYRKMEALVEDEDKYLDFEYHAGKSTFARKLRDKTGLPLYYLDMPLRRPRGRCYGGETQ